MLEIITFFSNYSVYIVGGLVAVILAAMLVLSVRNPIIAKLGVRNIPRRPAQTGLIVLGLTLSTIIIISSLSIGNTLSYSVRQQAVSAYGEIDEILSPPLLATLAGMTQGNNEAGPNLAEIQGVLSGDLMSFFRLLRDGLPGIPEERYAELRTEAKETPLIDGIAPSIIFPTIIRNVTSGQSEPLGFIFGVDDAYTQDFGLHTVTGQPAAMADLDTGVGNIFQTAFNLFGQARSTAEEGGFDISPSSLTLAGLGAFLGQQGLDSGQLELSPEMAQQFGRFFLGQEDQAEAERLSDLLNPELLSTVNLNTLRSDIDAVLARYGLQLRQGEVYLSRIAAEKLEAEVGDVVEIHIGPLPVPYRVKGIVEEAGPMSALWPVVVMRLDETQKLLLMPDRVNNILVSNQGDPLTGLAHTEAVSRRLRVLAVNPAAAEQLLDILRRPPVRAALDQAIAGYAPGPETARAGRREQGPGGFSELVQAFEQFESEVVTTRNLEILQAELEEPGLSEALRAALADAGVAALLDSLVLEPETQAELDQALQKLSSVTLIDPLSKATVVSTAEAGSQAFVVVFAIFGIFSVMAGVLLIFMIFVMLAAERRSELGMARAIGMQRGQLVQMFVSEGLVYDLLAAALGVVLGILASYAMVGFIGRLFSDVAGRVSGQSVLFQVAYHITPASIILAYCLGVLLTFVVVYLASWRVSSLNIVQAMRDLPEADAPRGSQSRLRRWGYLALALMPVVLGLALIFSSGGSGFIQLAVSLILVGLALALGRLLHGRTTLRAEQRNRLVYSIIGLGLLALWIVPWSGLGGLSDLTGAATWFVFSGPMLIVGAILAIIWNARAILWLVNRLMVRAGNLAPVLKMAIAYPLSARYRTGMAMAMFAIVITTVTVMSVVIEATQTAITPDTEAYAGFEIQPSPSLLSFFNPIYDLKTAIAEHPDFPEEQVAAVAQFSNLSAEAQAPGDSDWRDVNVIGLNPDYINQAEKYYRFQARAAGFESDAAVWQALREREDVAIATADLAVSASPEPPFSGPGPVGDEGDAPFRRRAAFTFEELDLSDGLLPADLTVDISAARPPADLASMVGRLAEGESPEPQADTPEAERTVHPVQIIAVLAPQNTLAGRGIQANEGFVAAVTGVPVQPDTFYVKVTEGANVRQVARQLESAFASSGLNVTITSEAFAQAQQLTRGILQLFQGFMALGLLVGIAALGVISSRTVVERRQQVGLVRAIGLQAPTVALTFLLETSFIALSGIIIGVATGMVLGQRMVSVFFPILTNGASYGLPWLQIGLIVLLAYLASLVTTVLPAYQASRIYPAEALRYE